VIKHGKDDLQFFGMEPCEKAEEKAKKTTCRLCFGEDFKEDDVDNGSSGQT